MFAENVDAFICHFLFALISTMRYEDSITNVGSESKISNPSLNSGIAFIHFHINNFSKSMNPSFLTPAMG